MQLAPHDIPPFEAEIIHNCGRLYNDASHLASEIREYGRSGSRIPILCGALKRQAQTMLEILKRLEACHVQPEEKRVAKKVKAELTGYEEDRNRRNTK